MKAAELFVRCLEAEGVEYVFGVPALVVVPIDYAENMKLSNRLGNLVCPI
jgi:thiamine pyrophosphate-dependent acetolactate synthase large subunit-like protein